MRRVIRTPGTIADDDELDRVRRFLLGERGGSGNAFDGGLAIEPAASATPATASEPFALLHQLKRSCADAAADAPDRRPTNGVTVRMYRQGHGDCFLLAFPREGGGEPSTC